MSNFTRNGAPAGVKNLAAGCANMQIVWVGNGSVAVPELAEETSPDNKIAAGDTFTFNGVTFTAVAADPGENEFVIDDGADPNAQFGNSVISLLQVMATSDDPAVSIASFYPNDPLTPEYKRGVFIIQHKTIGPVGDGIEFSWDIASVGQGSVALANGHIPDKMDPASNSTFALKIADYSINAIVIPNGVEGQIIRVVLASPINLGTVTLKAYRKGWNFPSDIGSLRFYGDVVSLLFLDGAWIVIDKFSPEGE